MENYKEQKVNFERKNNGGKPNPKYVDLLEEDKPISGQKFVCVSFCSPEKILKQKEVFFFEKFLKNWELNKSMEKFIQFLSFISFKYAVSLDDITNDLKEFVVEEKEQLNKTNLADEYKKAMHGLSEPVITFGHINQIINETNKRLCLKKKH